MVHQKNKKSSSDPLEIKSIPVSTQKIQNLSPVTSVQIVQDYTAPFSQPHSKVSAEEGFVFYYNWGKALSFYAGLQKSAEEAGPILDEAGERYTLSLIILRSMNNPNQPQEFSSFLEKHRETILSNEPTWDPIEGPSLECLDPSINLDVSRWLRPNDKCKRDLAMILQLFQKCPTFHFMDASQFSAISDTTISRIVSGISKGLHINPIPLSISQSQQLQMLFQKQQNQELMRSQSIQQSYQILDKPIPSFGNRNPLENLKLCNNLLITGNLFSLNQFPHLKNLNMGECKNVTDDVVAYITRSCPILQSLCLARNNRLVGLNHLQKLESLTELDLQECRRLTNSSFHNIALTFPNLSSINLMGVFVLPISNPNGMQNNQFEGLLELAKKCQKLKTFNLSNCKSLTADVLMLISDNLYELENLNLNNVASTNKKVVTKLIHRCKTLKSLSLSGCVKLGDETIYEIADFCPNLEYLDISRCKDVTVSIGKLAEKCTKMKGFCLSGCLAIPEQAILTIINKCPDLESLELGLMYKATNEVISSLTKGCLNLKKLNLQRCDQISDESLYSLSHLSEMDTLNLQESRVTDKTLKELMQMLPRIQKLNISNCKNLNCDPLDIISRYYNSLESLSFQWGSKFSLTSLPSLTKRGKCCLKKVDFRECKSITDEFICALASFCPKLEELWLDSCSKLSDQSVNKISQFCSIKVLRLTGIFRITDASIMHLAIHNPSLQILFLGKCYRITDASIIKVAKHCKNIRHLQLNGCKSITDASIMHLSQHSFSLNKLVLDACPQITAESIEGLIQKYPFLEVRQDLTNKKPTQNYSSIHKESTPTPSSILSSKSLLHKNRLAE
eukprot:TRINITY_DN8855_c0_g1_i2.p1 TRINITY_DN8855_c0_g1~~TRINITY_DN8855_c0_g1_i2.p1  ORF type:complete len:848 (+),score=159.19 TRINITY_DN8855_c0_g1_i2:317-2860(+)